MVIDHVNAIFFGNDVFPMLLIGRGAFPLFCYAVAVAVLKTADGKKSAERYILKLLLLAVLTQPFYAWALANGSANVIFTLAAGAAMAALSFRVRPALMYGLYAFSALAAGQASVLEFGLPGVMLPSAILLVLRGQRGAWVFLTLLMFLVHAHGLAASPAPLSVQEILMAFAVVGGAGMALGWVILDAARGASQTGRYLHKYALYIFYPAHLVLIKTLSLI